VTKSNVSAGRFVHVSHILDIARQLIRQRNRLDRLHVAAGAVSPPIHQRFQVDLVGWIERIESDDGRNQIAAHDCGGSAMMSSAAGQKSLASLPLALVLGFPSAGIAQARPE